MISSEELQAVNLKIKSELAQSGIPIAHIELCLHHPDEDCLCRKPKPELLKRAAVYLGVDLSRSIMIGDRESDLEAGLAARVQSICLVRTGHGQETEKKYGHLAQFIGDTLVEIAEWIISNPHP